MTNQEISTETIYMKSRNYYLVSKCISKSVGEENTVLIKFWGGKDE